jgi:hypothetical protein
MEMPLTMEAKVFPKGRDNIPTRGGDIPVDIINITPAVIINYTLYSFKFWWTKV